MPKDIDKKRIREEKKKIEESKKVNNIEATIDLLVIDALKSGGAS